MRVGDYSLLLLVAQRSSKRRVRAVRPNVVHVDVVEVGVYPDALQQQHICPPIHSPHFRRRHNNSSTVSKISMRVEMERRLTDIGLLSSGMRPRGRERAAARL